MPSHKDFLKLLQHGRVRSRVRPVCAARVALAAMLRADHVPIESTHFRVR